MTRLAVGYFALSTVMLVAPAFTAWGNHVEPRILGIPWSLIYVLLIIAANFGVLLALYARRVIDDDG